uniref:Reverse transcriptase domain-containing protein n=1 Tax=Podarcis muralis TaxID=64176 RepID=A0A670I2H7_PODMU
MAPPGFSVLHQSRTVGRGGGVAVLIREDCPFRALPSPSIPGIECVGLVWGSEESLAVWLVYQPPSAPAATLSGLLEAVAGWALEFPNLLVLGDFNFHADATPSSQALDLVSSMATLGLSQFVSGPTHQAGHTLDLIFGAGIDVIMSPSMKVPWSDHYALKARIDFPPPPCLGGEPIWVRPQRLMDPDRFRQALRDLAPPGDSLIELVEGWNTQLLAAIDEIAPKRPLRPRRNRAPWFTEELRKMKRDLRRLERVWRGARDGASRTSYRVFMKTYEMAVKAAKKAYFSASIASASSRPAQLFSIIRSLTSLEGQPNLNNNLTHSCEAFASFFAEKVLSLRHDLPANLDTIKELEAPRLSSGPVLDHFDRISPADVDRFLQAGKPTTCPLDPCPSWLIRACPDEVRAPLGDIINLSLGTGIFPGELKEAVVRPLLKKTSLDPLDLSNYRPVSNLPFLGKVIERAVAEQLGRFLDETSALDPFQSGFRAGHGTETALVALTDDLRRQLDRGGSGLLILLDLSAAFDMVDHELLDHRLADVGIQGTVLQWLRSFLSGRGQRVALGGELSSRHSLVCGVPQGAILSPMLFNIFMRPLAQLVRSFGLGCHQYADDTQLYLLMDGHPDSAPDTLTRCLEAVAGWLRGSRLKLNPSKTEVLWLGRDDMGSRGQLPSLAGVQLVPASSVKSLGVIFDTSLSMEAQITAITKAAFFHLRQAKQLAPYLSRPDLATVIHATVTSRLDYCNSLYVGLPLKLTQKLQRVQNAAARLLMGSSLRDHIHPVLYQLHWLPVEYRIRFKVLVLTFKALYGLGPSYLRDRLSWYAPQRNLRSANNNILKVPGLREVRLASTRARAFSAAAPIWWNALSQETKALRDLTSFRRACKTELFHQAFGQGAA